LTMEKLSRVFPLLRIFELDKGEENVTDQGRGPLPLLIQCVV
jgi:hypothetical protein